MSEEKEISMNESRMCFGIMCNGYNLQVWQLKVIHSLKNYQIAPSLLIIDAREHPKYSLFNKLINYPYRNICYRFFQRYFFKPQMKALVDIGLEFKALEVIKCRIQQQGYSEFFEPQDIDYIKSYKLDFILRFGFNIIRGEILNAAKYGIWSFHHDDEQYYRGGPPGFWEIFKADPVNGAMLQRLTNRLDAGIILKKGFFKTIQHSWKAHVDQLYEGTVYWPLHVCKEIINKNTAYFKFPESETKAQVFKNPGNFTFLRFIYILLWNKIRFQFNDIFITEKWNVGIIKKPIHEIKFIIEKDIHWLPDPQKGKYAADPFGFILNGQLHILYEAYDYKFHKGKIAHITLGDNLKIRNKAILMEGLPHFSYPYIFNADNIIYCIPETAAAKKVDLYKLNPETKQFEFTRTLLEGIDAVDPTLLNYHGKCWLFMSMLDDSNSSLYIYYADDLESTFLPHKQNPVKTDIRSSRPAGTPFIFDNILYRPSQESSITYGGGICINRIQSLSTDFYAEEIFCHLVPDKRSKYNQGIHTISTAGDYTLIDGKYFTFVWDHFLFKIREKINRISSRNHNIHHG